ncbi:MAG: 4Fe-4S dicluster domain-containing protein [Anaerofustis stercorihominis]|nr:4Fe-4S dicluster domain-containing protein [Anaerofustis stercorihominis]
MKQMKIRLTFPKDLTAEPVTYNLVKKFDISFNILKAHVDYKLEGTLLLGIEGEEDKIGEALRYLNDVGIIVDTDGKSISIDFDKCVHCGACTAVCVVNALEMGKDCKVTYHGERCLECMLCVKACPQRIIKNVFDY